MPVNDHLDAETRITSVREITGDADAGSACIVQLRGPEMGRRIELTDATITIGRDPESDLSLASDSVSRRHASIETKGAVHCIIDNSSTNGTYLNHVLIEGASRLHSGDFVQVGEAIFKYLCGDNIEASYHEEIYRLTIEDGLTKISNKRALVEFLDKEFARARRYERPLACVMFDLDHFKAVNDNFGHLTGDYVLREVARIVSARVRHEEMFARYGGEEFCVLLPEVDLEGALGFAEDVRKIIADNQFNFEGNVIDVTVSIGVALVNESMTRGEALILEADENLYKAKRGGRNRVVG